MILKPSERQDELGIAERELAGMQGVLADTLRQQRRLADLGLAVSKINHDLRNILASAQLISDRLSDVRTRRSSASRPSSSAASTGPSTTPSPCWPTVRPPKAAPCADAPFSTA